MIKYVYDKNKKEGKNEKGKRGSREVHGCFDGAKDKKGGGGGYQIPPFLKEGKNGSLDEK